MPMLRKLFFPAFDHGHLLTGYPANTVDPIRFQGARGFTQPPFSNAPNIC